MKGKPVRGETGNVNGTNGLIEPAVPPHVLRSPGVVLRQHSGYNENTVHRKQFSAFLCYSGYVICDMFLQKYKS